MFSNSLSINALHDQLTIIVTSITYKYGTKYKQLGISV